MIMTMMTRVAWVGTQDTGTIIHDDNVIKPSAPRSKMVLNLLGTRNTHQRDYGAHGSASASAGQPLETIPRCLVRSQEQHTILRLCQVMEPRHGNMVQFHNPVLHIVRQQKSCLSCHFFAHASQSDDETHGKHVEVFPHRRVLAGTVERKPVGTYTRKEHRKGDQTPIPSQMRPPLPFRSM
jgi:hypothetical protein